MAIDTTSRSELCAVLPLVAALGCSAFIGPSSTQGDHAGAAQAGDEGRGLPMSEGDAGAQALDPSAATMASCHVGRPGLVDEDQLVGIETELPSNHSSRRFRTSGLRLVGSERSVTCRETTSISRPSQAMMKSGAAAAEHPSSISRWLLHSFARFWPVEKVRKRQNQRSRRARANGELRSCRSARWLPWPVAIAGRMHCK